MAITTLEQIPILNLGENSMDPLLLKYLGEKYSDEERSKVEEQARQQKNNSAFTQAAAGFGDALAGRGSNETAQMFEGIRQGIDQNTVGKFDQGRKNALMDYELKNKFQADEHAEQDAESENDPNSIETQSFRQIGLELGMSPAQVNKMTAKQLKKQTSVFSQIHKLKQEAQLKRESMQDRRNSETDRKEARETSNFMKKQKADELSLGQAKQLGTYELGKLAEEQFQKATADKKKFDPTNVGQVFDNSDWSPAYFMDDEANTARSAKEAWVESFLRDASGAAIGENERLKYSRPYFPQPGDSEEVVKNKLEARRQKMQNALVGSGQQAHQALQMKQQQQVQPETVTVVDKNGKQKTIQAIYLKEAIKQGAKPVGNLVGQ